MMYGPEKSDSVLVAGKPTNKVERSAAESVERRTGTEGNAGQSSTCRTQSRISVSQGVGSHTATFCRHNRGGRSRMRESRTYGSVRGARGNSRPYHETCRQTVMLFVHGRSLHPIKMDCVRLGFDQIQGPSRRVPPCLPGGNLVCIRPEILTSI